MTRFLLGALALLIPWLSQAASPALLVDPAGGTVLFSDTPGSDDGINRGRVLGFNLAFFGTTGTTVSTVDVCVNGNLNFSGNTDFANVALGAAAVARICPLWDDLQVVPGSGDSVTEKMVPGSYYAVTWTVHDRLNLNRHVFQAVLFGRATTIGSVHFQAGDIAFSYLQVGAFFDKGAATVGLDAGDGATSATIPSLVSTAGLVLSGAGDSLTQNFGGVVLFRTGDSGYSLPMFDDSMPVVIDDVGYVDGPGRIVIPVLVNDSVSSGRVLALTSFTSPSAGVVSQNDDGSLNYKPGSSFAGHDQFTYTVTDDLGMTGSGKVTISTFDAAHGSYAGTVTDDTGATSTITLVVDAHGGFTGSYDDGTDPATSFSGAFDGGGAFHQQLPGPDADTPGLNVSLNLNLSNLTYSISGAINTTGNVAAMRIPNRPPTAVDDLIYVRGGGVINVPALANDSDPDGDDIKVTAFTQGTFGSVSLKSDQRTLSYFAASSMTGSDQFNYTISDSFGLTATATVRIVPAITLKGVYDGLIQVASATPGVVDPTTSGHLKVTVSATGVFSASFTYGGIAKSLHGTFGPTGRYTTSLVLSPATTVTLTLALDSRQQTNQITGTVSDGVNSAAVTLGRSRYDARNFPAPQAGAYTAWLMPDASNGPAGIGFARATVSKGGAVILSGRLGDGTVFSQGVPLGVDGAFPLYINLPHGRNLPPGFVLGQAAFADPSGQNGFNAGLTWYQPPSADGVDPGFSAQPELMGARYQAPKRGVRALTLPEGLENADLNVADTDVPVTIGVNNLVTVSSPNDLHVKLALQPATGMFTGSYIDATGDKPVRRVFAGALLQKQSKGAGLTLGGDFGPVSLGPPLSTATGL